MRELSYVTYATSLGIPRSALISLSETEVLIERRALDERMGIVRTYE
jgi:hypothetical protein